jgi:hypothetical protein
MVESVFVLLGTEVDPTGIPWALLARDRGGKLEFAGPAILRPPSGARSEWAEKLAALSIDKPALEGMRSGKAQWLKPEIRVRARHLKAKGTLRHATEGFDRELRHPPLTPRPQTRPDSLSVSDGYAAGVGGGRYALAPVHGRSGRPCGH